MRAFHFQDQNNRLKYTVSARGKNIIKIMNKEGNYFDIKRFQETEKPSTKKIENAYGDEIEKTIKDNVSDAPLVCSKEEAERLIEGFKREKSAEKKLDMLENIYKSGDINGEVLDFIDEFSKNLIVEKEKIWQEDHEFADEFESRGDDDDTVIRPFVTICIKIAKKAEGTEYQSRAEEVMMDLLKNWNDFEAEYFYDYIGDLNKWDREQTKEFLAESEFIAMHKEFGLDEEMDDFPEDIKSWSAINIVFAKTKNKAIESLGEIGSRKSADFLLDEFVSGGRSAHNKELTDVFNKIDPEYAKQKLIELAKSDNEIVKINAIMILYRLQFGESAENKDLVKNSAGDLACRKFHEIIDQTKLTADELKSLLKNEKDISEEEMEKISDNSINKAGQMLVDFSQKAGKGKNADEKEILKTLEDYKTDLILTASVYKGMSKESGIKFEDLKGVEFEKRTATDLSDEEISQMKKIYEKNYEYNPKFQKAIVSNFENILQKMKDKTALYLFKHNGEVIAFNRFDEMPEKGRKYFGSFNVNPVISGSDIGNALSTL